MRAHIYSTILQLQNNILEINWNWKRWYENVKVSNSLGTNQSWS